MMHSTAALNMQPALGVLQTLMLSSPALPIGAYCYSQGIETAIDVGIIHHEASALAYLQDLLQLSLARCDLPLLLVLMHSYASPDKTAYKAYAEIYRASRESKEMLAEVQQIAYSFRDWIRDLGLLTQFETTDVDGLHQQGFLPLYAAFNCLLGQSPTLALTAYAFSQLENLLLSVVKTVPLGQMAGQRSLWKLLPEMNIVIHHVLQQWQASEQQPELFLNQVGFSSSLPHLAFMSMQHENLYCRLFRS